MTRSAPGLSRTLANATALVVALLTALSNDPVSHAKPPPPNQPAAIKPPATKQQATKQPHAQPSDVAPQDFLVRSQYLNRGAEGIKQALDYRLAAYTQIRAVSFFGRGVLLHQAVHQPLGCVERRIKQHCKQKYQPKVLSGWRPYNTYKEAKDWNFQEHSNHIFGLALDIDPELNPCCGCVNDWSKSERCTNGARNMGAGKPPLGRHELPQCWIDAFKRYGFHWLGDDKGLRDTMHFEFLAEPGSVSCESPEAAGPR